MNRSVCAAAITLALAFGVSACGGGGSKPADAAAPATSTPSGSTAAPSDSTSTPSGSTAASSGSNPSSSGDATASGCKLATLDEITKAAGKPMAVSGDAGPLCAYSAAADPSFVLYAQVYSDGPSQATMTQIEPSSEHLAGMGDDAFWNATVGTIYVRKGSRAFSFSLPSLANLTATPAATKASMVTLAQAALSRF